MSYRNPKQVVDTQSGQHIRNMLQQISGATVGALNQIKKDADKKREENLADRKAQADRLFTAETELNQVALANPGLDVSKAIQGNLEKMELYLKSMGMSLINGRLRLRPLWLMLKLWVPLLECKVSQTLH